MTNVGPTSMKGNILKFTRPAPALSVDRRAAERVAFADLRRALLHVKAAKGELPPALLDYILDSAGIE